MTIAKRLQQRLKERLPAIREHDKELKKARDVILDEIDRSQRKHELEKQVYEPRALQYGEPDYSRVSKKKRIASQKEKEQLHLQNIVIEEMAHINKLLEDANAMNSALTSPKARAPTGYIADADWYKNEGLTNNQIQLAMAISKRVSDAGAQSFYTGAFGQPSTETAKRAKIRDLVLHHSSDRAAYTSILDSPAAAAPALPAP
jgi:hypothetical protein